MPNIGDRLEEARKRQGISIRKASEATKIRGDLLLSIESNNFDFDLPDVYKRGFLKLYGRYLKLDIDKLMTDFDAAMMGRSKVKRSDAREFFGRMDLPERTTPLGSKESNPPLGHDHGGRETEVGSAAENSDEPAGDTSLYWKIGLIFVGTFIIVGLLAMLVQSIFSSSPSHGQTDDVPRAVVAGGDTTTGGGSHSTGGTGYAPSRVKLIGLGDTNVIVKQINDPATSQDDKRIDEASGSIFDGDAIEFTREGPIMIVSPDIERIAVEIDGRRFTPQATGLRRWFIDENGPYTPGR